MRLRGFVLAAALGIVGCNDPATFVRSKSAADYPPETTKPTRVPSVSPSCELLGEITEATSLPDVETTVSRHGGTHYVVTDSREVQESVTQNQSLGGPGYGASSTHQTTRLLRAEVYRCKSDSAAPPAN